jgi:hypothetical protein
MLALSAACVVAVLLAVLWRILSSSPAQPEAKGVAVAVSAVAVAGLVAFALAGPLAPGWARRSGTPASLLPRAVATSGAASPGAAAALEAPFRAQLAGVVRQGGGTGGAPEVVVIRTRMSGGARGALNVRISGTALPNGGVSMTTSRVTLGPPASPDLYRGRITALQGSSFAARVSSASGRTLDLRATLQIGSTQSVSGVVSASAAGAGGG